MPGRWAEHILTFQMDGYILSLVLMPRVNAYLAVIFIKIADPIVVAHYEAYRDWQIGVAEFVHRAKG